MKDENRTDLPHNQVEGDQLAENNQLEENQESDLFLDIDERGTGMAGPVETLNAESENELELEGPVEVRRDKGVNIEEMATEIAPVPRELGTDGQNARNRENNDQISNIEEFEENEAGGMVLGWTALVLSIISLFFLPILTGTIGAVTGFFAYRNGSRMLGMWAVAIGLFSIVFSIFFAPYVR